MVIFSRQIATLFEADISPLRAFNLVSENVSNKYFQEILRDISKKVEQGFTLEKAFDQHKEVFGEFYIAIIAVGEKSGSLPRSFSYLATYVERNAEIIGRIRKALTYPIFIIIMFRRRGDTYAGDSHTADFHHPCAIRRGTAIHHKSGY